ncbi:YcaO-like family protein [Cytobacillus kochii]|uniref:YcaO domain-containing protein n=1 Tax=Cytobacillus kochii TaxID=859143 RepID=A0A248TPY5_9BACI|nr:YcaO-like family protein [Cytobacillus kochii]ASV70205.1 hypothetical protein CKF48_23255 [Cytobacillus kochii]
MNSHMKISPGIIKDFSFKHRKFYNKPFACEIKSGVHQGATGFSVGEDKSKVLKSAIGEHSERLASVKSNIKNTGHNDENPQLTAFNLLNGSTIKIPAYTVLLDFNLPIFQSVPISVKESFFSDSCGFAAHNKGQLAIENGFLEFIERQSLIHMWLTKMGAKQILVDEIKNMNLKTNIEFYKQSLDKFMIFNISFIKNVYVICTIGYFKNAFSIGVSADFEYEKAIRGSINEFSMILQSSLTKNSMDICGNNQLLYNQNESNLYAMNFYETDVNSFIEEYQFLFTSSEKFNSIDNETGDFYYILSNLKLIYDIDVYSINIDVPLEFNRTKIVKVISPSCYPHMNTSLFDPEEYPISRKIPANGFPNKYKPVLFA